jgi:hypothetical protein
MSMGKSFRADADGHPILSRAWVPTRLQNPFPGVRFSIDNTEYRPNAAHLAIYARLVEVILPGRKSDGGASPATDPWQALMSSIIAFYLLAPRRPARSRSETPARDLRRPLRSFCIKTSSILETDSHRQLKRPRAARPEHLSGPAGRLAERCARQIAAVTGEICLVVQIEHLTDER